MNVDIHSLSGEDYGNALKFLETEIGELAYLTIMISPYGIMQQDVDFEE